MNKKSAGALRLGSEADAPTLPTQTLDFKGRKIAVTRIEATGGQTYQTALYRDREGNFYTAFLYSESPHGRELVVREVTEKEALRWYVQEFIHEGIIKTKIGQAVSRFVRRSERPVWPCREVINGAVYDSEARWCVASLSDGAIYQTRGDGGRYFKAAPGEHIRPVSTAEVVEALLLQHLPPANYGDFCEYMPSIARHYGPDDKFHLQAWIDYTLADELEAHAEAEKRTRDKQLELFLTEGMAAHALTRPEQEQGRKQRGKRARVGAPVQLELLTSLVGYVSKFDRMPNAENLAQARRGVTALHRSLHSPEAFKRTAAVA